MEDQGQTRLGACILAGKTHLVSAARRSHQKSPGSPYGVLEPDILVQGIQRFWPLKGWGGRDLSLEGFGRLKERGAGGCACP